MTINRPYQVRSWDNDPVDDLHAVVGSYWLPLVPQNKQYNVVHGPALRDGNGYRYETSFVHAFGPYHPNQAKSALLVVTTNGVLKLFFSQNNNRVQETPIELESITTSDDLFTHASMCSEKSEQPGPVLPRRRVDELTAARSTPGHAVRGAGHGLAAAEDHEGRHTVGAAPSGQAGPAGQ